jgi:hypothetical protein
MNIFEAPPVPLSSTLSDYNNAVNASRFVKGFGIAVLAYSVPPCSRQIFSLLQSDRDGLVHLPL